MIEIILPVLYGLGSLGVWRYFGYWALYENSGTNPCWHFPENDKIWNKPSQDRHSKCKKSPEGYFWKINPCPSAKLWTYSWTLVVSILVWWAFAIWFVFKSIAVGQKYPKIGFFKAPPRIETTHQKTIRLENRIKELESEAGIV